MARKNNRSTPRQERRIQKIRKVKRNKASSDSLTYCTYERTKARLEQGGFTNSAPKITKVRFTTKKDAQRLLQRLKNEGREESRVYKCPTCNGYHLTKQPRLDKNNEE